MEDLSDRFEQVMNRLNVKLSSEQGVDETDELEESEDKVANFFALFELKVKIAEKRDQLVKKFKLISGNIRPGPRFISDSKLGY